MKKYLKYGILSYLLIVSITSCKDDFLEIPAEGQLTVDSFYKNEDQATQALVAVYDVMRKNSGGFENMITMFNAGCDDNYAGGGGASDGVGIQSFSNYTIDENTIPGSFWSDYYRGVYRANLLLEKLPAVDMDNALKIRFEAEAKALRSYYYFNLVIMFKNIPLILTPISFDNYFKIPQNTPEEVYAQIETDLLFAINNLPTSVGADYARYNKGAAQALLGKVYLYQNKNTEAANLLAQVNGTNPGVGSNHANQYGNYLLMDYNALWNPTNKFNAESIISVSHSSQNSYWGNWGSSSDEGNTVCIMAGPRSYTQINASYAPALPSGWSFNVFTKDFYNFINGDPRFNATILDMNYLKQNGYADYIPGYQDTGYFLNKFIPRNSDIYSGGGDAVLNYAQNTYAIRLADTYLMEAEALGATGRAQALLDAVRSRVGLPSVPVNMQAIKDERRRELAGEGLRWFDLVRWGDAATVLASRGFAAGKNEILPIPYQELQNTLIKQNPGY